MVAIKGTGSSTFCIFSSASNNVNLVFSAQQVACEAEATEACCVKLEYVIRGEKELEPVSIIARLRGHETTSNRIANANKHAEANRRF